MEMFANTSSGTRCLWPNC